MALGAEDVALVLDPNPGSTNGHVGGVIELRQVPSRATEFSVELFCTKFSHGNRDTSSSVVWQDLARFPCKMRADGAIEVPFCFYLPDEAPQTEQIQRDRWTWRLRISSTLDTEDFTRHWEVPVLASGVKASAAIAAVHAAAPPAAVLDEQMHLVHDASGVSIDYPAGRGARSAAFVLTAGAVFGGAGWMLGRREETFMQFMCWLIAVLAAAGGLWRIGNALHVEMRRGSLFIRRRLFGVPVSTTELAASSVAGIRVCKSAWSEQGANPRVFYNLQVKDLNGSTHDVGGRFVGYSAAVHAARRFSELTGWKVLDAPPAPAPAAAREPNESAPLIASPRMPAANTFVDRLVDNPRRVAHWRTIIQVFCALLFMWIGYTAGHARLSALLSGTQATGRIVDSRKELFQGKSGSHYSYMPIVEFDAGSRMVRFQDMWGESGPLPVGLTVPVIYDAANPTNALIDHGARNWMPWMPIAAVGAFLLLVALRSWLASMQAERLEAIAKAD